MTEEELLTLQSSAHWHRAAAEYINDLHRRLGIESTSFIQSLYIEAIDLEEVFGFSPQDHPHNNTEGEQG